MSTALDAKAYLAGGRLLVRRYRRLAQLL